MSILAAAFAPLIAKLIPTFNEGLVALVAIVALIAVWVYSRASIFRILSFVHGHERDRAHKARYDREDKYRTYKSNRDGRKRAAKLFGRPDRSGKFKSF